MTWTMILFQKGLTNQPPWAHLKIATAKWNKKTDGLQVWYHFKDMHSVVGETL